jgi:hypothetical protein
LEHAVSLNPSDPMLSDLDVLIKTHGLQPDRLASYAKDLIEAEASNALEVARGEFFLSYSLWKKGDRTSSIESLKKAVSLNPENEDYKAMLNKVSKPGAKIEDFKGTIKIGVGYGDFFK